MVSLYSTKFAKHILSLSSEDFLRRTGAFCKVRVMLTQVSFQRRLSPFWCFERIYVKHVFRHY